MINQTSRPLPPSVGIKAVMAWVWFGWSVLPDNEALETSGQIQHPEWSFIVRQNIRFFLSSETVA
jgi:hypothetical protein